MTMSAEDIVARKMVGNEGDISLESQCGQIHLSYRFSMVWYGMVWEIPSAEQRTRGRRDRASYL